MSSHRAFPATSDLRVGPALARPAIVASNFYPHVGGVEETVRQLALRQRASGANPLVVTMRWPKNLPKTDQVDGIEVRRHVFRAAERRPKQFLGALLTRDAIAHRVVADIRAHQSSVVHVQCVSINGWYALRAARRLSLPLVVTVQGELTMDESRVYERSRVLPPLLRQLLREADAVTACSAATLAEAEQWAGVELGSRGRVVFNGVSLDDFDVNPARSPTGRPYIFAIGRLARQKGFDVLLRAFACALRKGFPYDLVLAGDGSERLSLQTLAVELGIPEKVAFLGATPREDVPALFAGSEFFVLPSLHEPMGIVNLEAMAARRAVVATRVGGVPELVGDGENGLLVSPGDSLQLTAALVKLATDRDLARRLGEAGRVRVERFDWAAIAREYDDVYRQASERLGNRQLVAGGGA
jgi:glycosyltransferase involved in cell wall biosynthesis